MARLSKNWIVAKLATVYVELIRNMPLLLQLLFWYNAVIELAAAAARSWSGSRAGFFLNNARPVHAEADPRERRLARDGRVRGRRRRRDRLSTLGEAAAGADRRAVSRRLDRRSR